MFKTYEKMNLALMKNEFKKQTGKNWMNNYFMLGNDGFVYACVDGYRLYRIVKDDFLLDVNKLPENKNLQNIFEKAEKEAEHKLYYTGVSIMHNGTKLEEFSSRECTSYFNEKFLSEFGKLNDLVLITKDELSVAIIQSAECNFLDIGLICPVRR